MTTESTQPDNLSKKEEKIDTSSKHPSEMTNPELDAAIATEVMGWEIAKGQDGLSVWTKKGVKKKFWDFWSPTTDANQADEAVRKFGEKGVYHQIAYFGWLKEQQEIVFYKLAEKGVPEMYGWYMLTALPRQQCEALILAKRELSEK